MEALTVAIGVMALAIVISLFYLTRHTYAPSVHWMTLRSHTKARQQEEKRVAHGNLLIARCIYALLFVGKLVKRLASPVNRLFRSSTTERLLTPPSRLFQLPAELRARIWDLAIPTFDSVKSARFQGSGVFKPYGPLQYPDFEGLLPVPTPTTFRQKLMFEGPPLLRGSKQGRSETLGLFFSRTCFRLDCTYVREGTRLPNKSTLEPLRSGGSRYPTMF